jgi:tight adherence protein B
MTESQVILLVSVLSFLAVIALIEGLYMAWRAVTEGADPKISRRLRRLSAGGSHGKEVLELLEKKQLSSHPVLNYLYSGVPRIHAMDALLEQAGMAMSVSRFMLLQAGVSLVLILIGIILLGLIWPISVLVGVVMGFALPYLYAMRRAYTRRAALVKQLPDMLDFVARALRAGNPFAAALKEASKEMPAPIATELAITFDEMNYGLQLEDALYNFAERTGSQDVSFFVAAVLIQKSTGGNLADLLNRLAEVLRARARTRGEIDIQSGEMKLTARLLIALPFLAVIAMLLIDPKYILLLLDHPIGQIIVILQVVLMLMGYWVVRKMINFRV